MSRVQSQNYSGSRAISIVPKGCSLRRATDPASELLVDLPATSRMTDCLPEGGLGIGARPTGPQAGLAMEHR